MSEPNPAASIASRLPAESGWWMPVIEGKAEPAMVLAERGWFAVGDDYEHGPSYSMTGWGNPDVEWHRVDPIPLHQQSSDSSPQQASERGGEHV